MLDTVKADNSIRAGDVQKVIALVDSKVMPYVDFQRMTASAVGRYWRQATPEQQKRLQDEFKILLVRTYSGALAQVKDQTVQLKPMRSSPEDTEVVVRSEVRGKGDPIQLDYRLEKTPSGWKIYDVNVLGVWLVENYRNSFAQEIGANGVDGLIAKLAERNKAAACGRRKELTAMLLLPATITTQRGARHVAHAGAGVAARAGQRGRRSTPAACSSSTPRRWRCCSSASGWRRPGARRSRSVRRLRSCSRSSSSTASMRCCRRSGHLRRQSGVDLKAHGNALQGPVGVQARQEHVDAEEGERRDGQAGQRPPGRRARRAGPSSAACAARRRSSARRSAPRFPSGPSSSSRPRPRRPRTRRGSSRS